MRGHSRNAKEKALFIRAKPDASVEDVIQIAKSEALKIGFRRRSLICTSRVTYDAGLDGWIVVVQSPRVGSGRKAENK
jgi:hypothetical protein